MTGGVQRADVVAATVTSAHSIVLNKTYEASDLYDQPVKELSRKLSRYARRLFIRGVPFAVNGVLRRRFYIRSFKMWEYARGLAYSHVSPAMRVLDFGGGATLPVFYLAAQGCEVFSVDINKSFVEYTNHFAQRHGLRLSASSVNLCDALPPPEWGSFDRIFSFCVIEHLPEKAQGPAIKKLAGLLRPGGIMVVTFDFGPEAPSEWPIRSREEVDQLVHSTGLRPLGNEIFQVADQYFVIDKRYPQAWFTLGSLFLTTPS